MISAGVAILMNRYSEFYFAYQLCQRKEIHMTELLNFEIYVGGIPKPIYILICKINDGHIIKLPKFNIWVNIIYENNSI